MRIFPIDLHAFSAVRLVCLYTLIGQQKIFENEKFCIMSFKISQKFLHIYVAE